MSNTLNFESFPQVARYFPHLEVAKAVTGEEGCASKVTTGLEPMFGVHIVISPEEWAMQITAF